jgi:hypothetical protein
MKTTRREFLTTAASAPVLGPILLGVQDKAGVKAPVLGQGGFTYEAIHDWGTLPANIRWGNTHGVVEDSQGHIYIHHTVHSTSEVPDSMVVFDRNARFVRSWGKEFRGVAHGLHIRKEGSTEFLYLTVNSVPSTAANPPAVHGAVVKATLEGEIVWRIQGPPDIEQYRTTSPTPRYNPTNLAVAPNGDVYVADGYGFYYINQYDANGQYLRTFGGRAPGATGPGGAVGPDAPLGTLAEPHGIWMDTRSGSSILLWPTAATRASSVSRSMESRSARSPDTFDFPAISMSGRQCRHSRSARPRDARRQGQQVDPPPRRFQRDQLEQPASDAAARSIHPWDLRAAARRLLDRAGNIFVVEWVEVGRVTKLRKVA